MKLEFAYGLACRMAQALRLAVHLGRERRLAAPHRLGEDDRRVVARLHDQPAQQLLDGRRLGRIDEHPRADRLPRGRRDRGALVERELALLDRVEREIGGHQLGE
ncbi:MAG TPA: hypothetical protein PKC20_14770, partial [Burkholderiaceae bacterium]|nr:hypothetical protein [Burkholderiaceae bacterium]